MWAFPQQPAPAAYGGMGLCRESVWISLADENFEEKSSKIYREHVDFGSTGERVCGGGTCVREEGLSVSVSLSVCVRASLCLTHYLAVCVSGLGGGAGR